MDNVTDVAIVGGGITGLATALALADAGRKVTVFEAQPRLGGAIHTESVGEFLLEAGPNSTRSLEEFQQLVSRLGLNARVLHPQASMKKRYVGKFTSNGIQLEPAPLNPFSALLTSLLSVRGKLRILWEIFSARTCDTDETVADFVTRHFGAELCWNLVDALMGGIWAADISTLSAQSALSQLWKLDQDSGSIIRGGVFKGLQSLRGRKKRAPVTLVTFIDGMGELVEKLTTELHCSQYVQLLENTPITSLQSAKSGYILRTASNNRFLAAQVLLATDAKTTSRLLESYDPLLAHAICAIPYAPLGVLHVSARSDQIAHQLDGFGFLLPRSCKTALLGAIFSSSLFPGRAPAGKQLLTCFVGGARNRALSDVTKETNRETAIGELRSILHITGEITVLREQYLEEAIPNYALGHHEIVTHVRHLENRLPGLYCRGNWLRGLGVVDRLKEAQLVSDELLCSVPFVAESASRALA